MNRLKYVFAINVPRRIPSNTTIITENRNKEVCRRHRSEMHLKPLLKPARFLSPRMRRINDCKSFHCTILARNETSYVPQRNRVKSDLFMLKKTSSNRTVQTEYVPRRHNSTCQIKKLSNVKREFVPIDQKIAETVKDERCLKIQEKDEVDSSLEKEPRTYAQMIANYSQTIYAETSSGILRDGLSTGMINGIHRSPFSSASMVSLKWKNNPEGMKSGCLHATNPYTFNQKAKFNSDTTTMRYECRNDRKDFVISNPIENKVERSFSSYATMIERYSNALDVDWNNNLVPRRNASTKLNDFSMMLIDSKDRPMELAPSNKNNSISGGSNDISRKEGETRDQIEWMAKVEDVIKDLKRITAKKEEVDVDSSEKWALQPVDERAEWLDRVVGAYKKNKSMLEKTSENLEPKGSTIAASNENRGPTMQTANGGKSSSIAEYIKRGPLGSSTTNTSSQPPTSVATGSTRQPQIELRMTPSQNESVVSINVDELAAKTAGTGVKEQLSVIISSKRNKVNASNTNVRSNFDSMQISISENTIPIKQIEFSINGKPVSELKSIVARANKLDVVSSMDKVEIRIPPNENANMTSEQVNLMKSGSDSKKVLNLQIAAKFNEPRAQQPKDTGVKMSSSIPPSPASSTPAPTPKPTPIPTPTKVPPYKPPRTQNLSSSTSAKNETPSVTNKVIEEQADASSLMKKDRISTQSTVKSDDATFQRSDINIPSMTNFQQSTTNKNPDEDRIASNTIPWWSSEDSFRKIKKKENTSALKEKLVKKVEEDTGASLEFEQTLHPGAKPVNLVDLQKTKPPVKSSSDVAGNFRKTETPVKDLVTKPVLKENEGSSNLSKQTFRAVPIGSPQKLAPIKRGRFVRASKQKKATSVSKVVKKARYRVKRLKVPIATKKESEKPFVSAVRSPKVIKYVSVNPQTVFVGDKRDTSVKASGPGERKTESNVKGPNSKEPSETSTKLKKVAEDETRAGKTNVQHSNSVFKASNDFGKPANKSADISAKSSSVRVQGNQDKQDLPSRRESVEEDRGIKQILKSMKPIEKRKDGTLIDYGVVVPSRTPPTQLTDDKFDSKKETSGQEKIVEPQKVFSTKKQTLTEPKTEPPVNIVEPGMLSSVKKTIEPTKFGIKREKIGFNESEEKKQDKKSTILVKKEKSWSQKNTVSKFIESETNSSTSGSSDKNQPLKTTNAELPNQSPKNLSYKSNLDKKPINVSSKDNFSSSKMTSLDSGGSKSTLQTENKEKALKGAPSVQPSKVSVKTNNNNAADFSKLTERRATVEKQGSKSSLKTGSQAKVKSEGSLLARPPKDSVKASDTDITNFSESKSLDKPTSRLQSAEKTGSKSTLKPTAEDKVSLKEIVHPPRTTDKKSTRTDPLPLMETIASPSSQKFTDKAKKNDSKSSAEPIVRLGKKATDTEMAPLGGAINYQSVKKQDNLTSLNSSSQKKKTISEIVKQRKKDLCTRSNALKSSLGKNSGSSGSNGPASTLTGPAGLQSSRSFTVSQICSKTTVSYMKNESDRVERDTIPSRFKQEHDNELFSNETKRSEKDILYSFWLHRFKSQFDDDKFI